MSCTLLFSELAALTTPRLGQSEQWLRFSLNEATKTDFKKQVNELMTWPTSVGLDPRYVSLLSCAKHCIRMSHIAVINLIAVDVWPTSLF